MTLTEIQKWLQEPIPESEIEYTDDTKQAAYQPIWVIEGLLDILSPDTWNRVNHKFTIIDTWIATSFELEIYYGNGKRVLLCSSFINPLNFPDSSNLLQTGIAEATKAGVKVLGRRFGKGLNDRMVLKPKPEKLRRKAKPDAQIMKAYLKAVHDKDLTTIERLANIYEIKTEENYAT